MLLQESGEMYLETIYVLQKTKAHVRAVDIAEHMGFSKPSISRAMGLLKSGGYIHSEEDGAIALTEAGLAIAEKIYERHTLLTQLLVGLGVPHSIAADDACKMEHAISDASFEAIKVHVQRFQK